MTTQRSLQVRTESLAAEFSGLQDWESKYKHLIKKGQGLPALETSFYDDRYKVKGCQSQVWMHAQMTDGRMVIWGDSDALIVKGLVAILLEVYSDASPEEILSHPPEFFKTLGLGDHLSPSRSNGFYAMVQQIMLYATAFKALGTPR